MKSAFGSSFKNAAPLDFFGPPPPKPKHRNVLHNLLQDAMDTAKGIPFGMVELAKNPVGSFKAMGQSYADTYGHGWGHFKKQFMAHPLQPLLDAISVPLVLAGGVGVGIKGASTVANIGRAGRFSEVLARSSELAAAGKWAEADALRASTMRAPRLDRAAQHFRKGTTATTRMVEVPGMPGVVMPKAYSTNLFRRFLTRGTDALIEPLLPASLHPGLRLLAKEKSRRAAATASAAKGQAGVLMGAKKAGLDPNEVAAALGERFERAHVENALKVDAKYADQLQNSARFREDFEFIYAKKPDKVEAEFYDPDTAPGPYIGAERQLPPGRDLRADEKQYVEFGEAGPATRNLGLKGYETEQMRNLIETMAKRVETGQDASRAMIQDGHVLVVRKGIGDKMIRELEGTAEMANFVYRSVQGAWKGIILGLSPRYFVNNVLGNATMYVAATNPAEFTNGILQAVRQVRGNRAAARESRRMENTLDGLMKKYMPDDWVHERAGFLQHGALGLDQTVGMRLKSKLRRAGHARLYTITEQVSYRGPQRSALMGALHTDKDFRNLYRHNLSKGMDRMKAYQSAANTIFSDARKRAAMEKRVTDWAGQYYHLNSLEKKITAFVPFYTWDRHALRFGKEQVLSRPVSSVVLAQLGALGDEAADRELGKIPDFMKGAIPVKGHDSGVLGFLLGQNIKGREKILLTAGYNPLAAAADNVNAIAAMFGQGARDPSEAVGGQVNPIISGFISGVTGQRLFSGAKAETHGAGPIGGIYEETFVELPYSKILKGLIEGKTAPTTTSKGTPTLYKKDMRQMVSSIMGLNERDFSPVAAERLYRSENKIKKGRRQKRKQAIDDLTKLKSNF